MKTIHIHAGYPKAASTFIQKGILPNIKNINILNVSHGPEFEKLLSLVYYSEDKEFLSLIDSYTSFFDNIDGKNINVYSSEGLTTFGGKKDFKIDYVFKRLKLVAERKNLNFKFFLIIRNQSDYLLSRYAQGHGENSFYSANKEFKKFKKVVNYFYLDDKNRKVNEKNLFETFNYYKEIINLKKLFEEENVTVGLFEHLDTNVDLFLKGFFSFLNLDIKEKNNLDLSKKNAGKKTKNKEYFRRKHLSAKPIKGSLNIITSFFPFKKFFLKILNRNFKNKIKIYSYQLDRILLNQDRVILSQDDVLKIKNYYSEDNEKLSSILKIDLKKFNY